MKKVTGQVVSTKPVSLSKAARTISAFVSADNGGASQAVAAYLRRTSTAFNELVQFHKENKASNLKKIKKIRPVDSVNSGQGTSVEIGGKDEEKEEDSVKIGQQGLRIEGFKGSLGNEEKVEGKKETKKKKREGGEKRSDGSLGIEKKVEASFGNGEKVQEGERDMKGKTERRKKEKKVEGGEIDSERNMAIRKYIEGSLGDEEVNMKDDGRSKERMKKHEDLERGIKVKGQKEKKRKSEVVDDGKTGHKKKRRVESDD